MRSLVLLALVLGVLTGCKSHNKSLSVPDGLWREVDPLIGTIGGGNVYPGASAPHGMVQLSPDNGLPGWDRISGYYYLDSTIGGFSHTHLSGTGAGDLYDVSYLPYLADEVQVADAPLGLHARFDHDEEEAHAGYYSVRLRPYDIRVELTATERVGVQRYTFERESRDAVVRLDLSKATNWDKTLETQLTASGSYLEGYRYSTGWARDQRVYFYASLSRQPDSIRLDSIPLYATDEAVGTPIGYGYTAYLHYRVEAGDTLVITTALSGVDLGGARLNHEEEAPHHDFDRYRHEAQQAWQTMLSPILIDGATPEQRRTFYTALYRAHLCPTLYSDVDGRYLGADRVVHRTNEGEHHYSTFSLWDTYRATHPLYNLIAPERSRQMVQSLIDFGLQNQGHLPVWNMWGGETDMMIGYHSVPVIVEAILKGVYQVKDPAQLTALLRSTAERVGYRGLDDYRSLGYVPSDKHHESVSLTLEYAYDDAAIAQWARFIGDSALLQTYDERAKSYRRVWDSETGFFRPRLSTGAFKPNFNPFAYTPDYTESNAYQYLMSVQHDPEGLRDLMGGAQGLGHRLDELFSVPTPDSIQLPLFSTGMIGQYVQGNEPAHHNIYLYNYARQPWRTAELSQQVLRTLYNDQPGGLCGNEDCGQMSAWYIFASMGLYPLDPLSGRYELGSPLWERTELRMPNGRTVTIIARGLSPERKYIRKVRIDGLPYERSYITYEHLRLGATIELEMTADSGHCWY